MTKKLSQEEFIERCIETRGTKFNYSEVLYVDATTKVLIGCECGNFWNVIPGNFTFLKHTCYECKKRRHKERCNKEKLSIRDFIERSLQIHCRKYDYSQSNYTGVDEKIDIICPIHGLFRQIAYDHMNGIGCNKCRVDRLLMTKIDKGIIRNFNEIPEFELYRNKIENISNQNYRRYKNLINPMNFERGYEYNLDHIFSIQQGFLLGILPNIIGHYTNLRIIPAKENRIKHSSCGKTVEELYEDYEKYL